MPNAPLPLLLIEGNRLDCELIERTLRGAAPFYALTVARDWHEALELLLPHNGRQPLFPALILLDLKLPGMDGIEFLRQLRQDPRLRACIVFVLADSDAEADMRAAYEHAVAGYILKADLASNTGKLLDLLESYREAVEFPVFVAA
mgnify:CR=1 FL=1